jgi:hypothetical protein
MKHRYKAADRMLGDVDMVPVAAQQTEILGAGVGKDWVIALDLSDIRKQYARSMENLALIHDGSTGETAVPGYGLTTAAAWNPTSQKKGLPLPLLFEVWSSMEEEFVSQPHIWLEAIDQICAATRHGIIVIDREADNGRIIRRLIHHKRESIVRIRCGNNSRTLFHGKSHARVRDLLKEATFFGELEAVRISRDGKPKPYRARYGSLPVRLPGLPDKPLWICVFDSPDHEQPMVVLTSRPADTAEQVQQILLYYFARWGDEELHRFAKQAFQLENIRFLTWSRIRNMVALVWIALGAIARFAQDQAADVVLPDLEVKAQRIRKPLRKEQFWGYTLVDAIRVLIHEAPRRIRMALWHMLPVPPEPDPQMPLFGNPA